MNRIDSNDALAFVVFSLIVHAPTPLMARIYFLFQNTKNDDSRVVRLCLVYARVFIPTRVNVVCSSAPSTGVVRDKKKKRIDINKKHIGNYVNVLTAERTYRSYWTMYCTISYIRSRSNCIFRHSKQYRPVTGGETNALNAGRCVCVCLRRLKRQRMRRNGERNDRGEFN